MKTHLYRNRFGVHLTFFWIFISLSLFFCQLGTARLRSALFSFVRFSLRGFFYQKIPFNEILKFFLANIHTHTKVEMIIKIYLRMSMKKMGFNLIHLPYLYAFLHFTSYSIVWHFLPRLFPSRFLSRTNLFSVNNLYMI